MAWLQKRPQVSDSINFYSSSLNKTLLIVGLGNPGKQYLGTRHNVGFMCIDDFVNKNDEVDNWIIKKDLKAQIASAKIGSYQVIFMKPTVYMNESGEAVSQMQNYYRVLPADTLVIHDDLDIEFGTIRIRLGGSSGGHNGLKSIIEFTSEDFSRIRVGISKPPAKIPSEKYVLSKFNEAEVKQLPNLNKEVNSIISEYIYSGKIPNETRSFLI